MNLAQPRCVRFAILASTICLVVASFPGPVAAGPQKAARKSSAPAALNLVEKRYTALKTMSQTISGKVDMSAQGDTATATIDAKVQIARPNRFRLDMKMNFFGEDRRVVIVSDGKRLIEYNPDDREYTEAAVTAVTGNPEKLGTWFSSRTFDISIPLFLTAGRKSPGDRSVYKTAQGNIDGMPVTVVTITQPGKSEVGPIKLYLDTKERLIRRFSLSAPLPRAKTGGPRVTLTIVSDYVDIETEMDIPSDAFEFSPPSDARKLPAVRSIITRAFDISR